MSGLLLIVVSLASKTVSCIVAQGIMGRVSRNKGLLGRKVLKVFNLTC